jgi:spermidine/putrescine transport system substrate-binding protein
MRKFLLVVMVVFALTATVFAQEATPEAEPWVCPEGFEGQTLSVYNWSTYVADNTIPDFEEACGVTVVYDVYGSNEEMLARLSQGNPGYDIIVPTGYMVETMVNRELLEPLTLENIPNAANVSEFLLDPVYDPANVYSLPYQWGTLGIGYNINSTGEEITTWEQVFAYDGPVAWIDDPRFMFGVALSVLGFDPNTENPDEIAQARDFLIENGGNVVAIAADDGQALLERGDVDIAIEYNGDIFQLRADCACEDYVFALPEPSAQRWVDNLAIPAGAPNKALAEVFIDYILDPQVGADISNYTAYASPNQAAIDAGLVLPEYLNETAIYPDEETSARLFTTLAVPEAEQAYNDAWDEVKILLGR